jgi:long-chain acyl-CoA synthetase
MDFSEKVRETFSRDADRRAIEFQGKWHSWRDIATVSDRLEALLAEAGIPKGAPIGLAARNRALHAAALLGLIANGRPLTMIYAFQSPQALAADIARLGLAAVIADMDDWRPAPVAAARDAGSIALALSDAAEGGVRIVEGTAPAGIRAFTDLRSEPTIELLTSGTTGAPKRIPIRFTALTRAIASMVLGGPPKHDTPPQMMFWPISNVGGLCNLVTSGVLGTPMVLMEKFTVEGFMDGVRRYHPPLLSLTSSGVRMIIDSDATREDFEGVKAIFGGSAHLDPDLQDQFEERYGVPIYWGFGATEFCGTVIRWTPALRQEFGAAKRGSIGCAMDDVQIRAIDPATFEAVAPGEPGLLEVQVPNIGAEWLRTTDLVTIDGDGFVFHRGRNDGAITRGGFKILPETIVEALRGHASVADAAVVGLPDPRLGQVPAAALEVRPGVAKPSAAELESHIRAHLPATHVPVRFLVVDALPRTPSMKVRLGEVRDLLIAEEVREDTQHALRSPRNAARLSEAVDALDNHEGKERSPVE